MQRPGTVNGWVGERVGLQRDAQGGDAHVRVGLERVRCEMRPAHQVGL